MTQEKKTAKEIIREILKLEIGNLPAEKLSKKINEIKIKTSKKNRYNKIIKNNTLLQYAKDEYELKKLSGILQIKKIRTISGVTVVALFCKPHKCPHGKCIFCPGGINSAFEDTPQSYTGSEPAAMRAKRNDYEPYLQIFNRLEHYALNGITPDKLELIIMGGTFPSLNKKYKEQFIKETYKAINDFGNLFIKFDTFGNKIIDHKKLYKFFKLKKTKQDENFQESKQVALKKKIYKLKNEPILNLGIELTELFQEINKIKTKLKKINKKKIKKDIKIKNEQTKKLKTIAQILTNLETALQKIKKKRIRTNIIIEDIKQIKKIIEIENEITEIRELLTNVREITLKTIKKFDIIILKTDLELLQHLKKKEELTKNEPFKKGIINHITNKLKIDKKEFKKELKDILKKTTIINQKTDLKNYLSLDTYIKFQIEKINKKEEQKKIRNRTHIKLKKWSRLQKTKTKELEIKESKEIITLLTKEKNRLKKTNYREEILRCEYSLIRPIGLTIETRPDFAKKEHLLELLKYGTTRLEIGVQTLDNELLLKTNRGHTVKEIKESFKTAKNLAFKINAHMMINYPFSTPEKDLQNINKLFNDENFKPDMIKIYPCVITKGTELYKLWKKGEFKPYTKDELIKQIIKIYQIIPRWCRIMRIQRDIPTTNIIAGVKNINLREIIEKKILRKKDKTKIKDIRIREIGFKKLRNEKIGKPKLKITKYKASNGIEYFIEFTDKYNTLFGFCRLRLPNIEKKEENIGIFNKKTALIRELHIYGKTETVGTKQNKETQHRGLGKNLIKESEKIAKKNGYAKITIISGIGVREYYKKLGYKKEKNYMTKNL